MKNIRLIAFLFNTALAMLCLGSTMAWADQNNNLPHVTKTEFSATGKISVSFLELKATVKSSGKDKTEYNYGMQFTSKPFTPLFPVTIKAGKLTPGGSITRLNSPELSSTINAFGSNSVRIKELQASLPSESSFSKPDSLFTQILVGNNKLNFMAGAFYDSSTLTCNTSFKASPSRKLELALNVTGGIYPYKQNTRTTWFSEQPFFTRGNHICANGQLFVHVDMLSSLFTVSTYSSPQGIFQNTYRIENTIKFRHFSFNLNAFYNKFDGIITSSGAKLTPLLQVQGGGQYNFSTGTKKPVSVTTGFNAQTDINLNSNIHSAKAAFGVKFNTQGFSGSFTANTDTNIHSQEDGIKVDFDSGSVKAAFGLNIKEVHSQLSATISFSPDSKKEQWYVTQKYGLSFEYGNVLNISNSNTLTLSHKKENRLTFTSSLTAKAQFRFCSLRVHLEFQV